MRIDGSDSTAEDYDKLGFGYVATIGVFAILDINALIKFSLTTIEVAAGLGTTFKKCG